MNQKQSQGETQDVTDFGASPLLSVLPHDLVDQLNNVFVKLRHAQSRMPSTGDVVLRQMVGKTCHHIDELLRENESKIVNG